MKKLRQLAHRHPRYVIAFVSLLLAVLLFDASLLFLIGGGRLPGTIWLPSSTIQRTDDEVLSDLPIKSGVAVTGYGRAIRYTSAGSWERIYEFHSSPILKASACPNITFITPVVPSGCDQVGRFHGQAVYVMHRRLPSGMTEYYVKLDDTFLYIQSGGDGGESLDYLRTFVSMSRNQAGSYLSANATRVGRIQAKQRAQKAVTDHNNSLAYTRLDFTPAIPKSLPAGWHLNTRATTNPIEIVGPDADHPTMVTIIYNKNNKDNKDYVSLYIGKLSTFALGATCGPTPGFSMEYLPCHKVPNTNYYEATPADGQNDYVRYLYYPVGDSLVISEIENINNPSPPTDVINAQNIITLSAQPVDKNTLKGTSYGGALY